MTVPEAAAAVGVSERHLRATLPELPCARLGRRLVIPVDAFRDWLTERARREGRSAAGAADEILGRLKQGVSEIR